MNKFKHTFFVYQFFFTLPWFILQYFVPKLRLCKVQFVLDYYLECLQLFKYNLLNYFETKWCVELKKVQHSNCCHVLISLQLHWQLRTAHFHLCRGPGVPTGRTDFRIFPPRGNFMAPTSNLSVNMEASSWM